jgi:hypothetical protein
MNSRPMGWKETGHAVLLVALNVFLFVQVFGYSWSGSIVFAQPYGAGQACTNTGECQTGLFCADGVCCNTACNGPRESCNVSGSEGICTMVQAAPTLSPWAQGLTFALLVVAGWTLLSRNRAKRHPK